MEPSKKNLEAYFRHYREFVEDGVKYVEDHTDFLMFVERAPWRIKKILSITPKFIVLLRDPVERTISQYYHNYKRFYDERKIDEVFDFTSNLTQKVVAEEKKKVERAIERKLLDLESQSHQTLDPSIFFRYIYISLYEEHIQNYFTYFPRKNFHFILTEQLAAKPLKIYQEILKFLKIDQNFVPESLENKYNRTKIPKEGTFDSFIHHFLRPAFNCLYPFDKKPDFLVNFYHKLFFRNKPETSKKLVSDLFPIFEHTKRWVKAELNLPVEEYWG